MSQHNFQEFQAFTAAEAVKPYAEKVELVRMTDFDLHPMHLTDSVGAYELQADCVQWAKDHTKAAPGTDTQNGNMKVRVLASNHTPKGISPWLDLEQVPAWKAGKIPS
jgi:hypothetical protein